jgi:hypothetical protein
MEAGSAARVRIELRGMEPLFGLDEGMREEGYGDVALKW